jgi:low temperature requirement protein LtrA
MIRRPRLFIPDEPERHVTWLELFFDLVFVVAVAELAGLLHNDLSLPGLALFAALFVPVWWQWIDFSYYADQFDTGNVLSSVVTLVVMFGVILLALTIHQLPKGASTGFATAYLALRAIIIVLYLWVWRTVPEARELAGRYSLSFIIAAAIWVVSLIALPPVRFWLWGLALLIEIANGPITYATIKQAPRQRSHMDERFGLFVIIVLGEAVVAVSTGVADSAWRPLGLATAAVGFLLASLAWWVYFARADPSVINQALRSNRRGLLRSFLYGYSHLPVFAGITAAGVGIEAAITADAEHPFALAARLALGGGLGAFLLGVGVVQWATPRSLARPVLATRLVGALICVALAYVDGLDPLSFCGVLVAVLVAQIGVEKAHESRSSGRAAARDAVPGPSTGVAPTFEQTD